MAETELNDDELVDYDDEGEALDGVGNAAAGDVKAALLRAGWDGPSYILSLYLCTLFCWIMLP